MEVSGSAAVNQARAGAPHSRRGRLRLQPELEVEDVGEFDFEAVGAASVVAEVGFAEGFGGELEQLVLVRSGGLGTEEAGGVAGWEGEGEVADA